MLNNLPRATAEAPETARFRNILSIITPTASIMRQMLMCGIAPLPITGLNFQSGYRPESPNNSIRIFNTAVAIMKGNGS